MGLLRWLRGDVDAFGRADREAAVAAPTTARAEHLSLPPDAVSFEVNVETKSAPGRSTLEVETVQPRIRQEEDRVIVEIDLPGLREETVSIERGETETRVSGERRQGSFVVRLRASPPPHEDDVEIDTGEDALTIAFPLRVPRS